MHDKLNVSMAFARSSRRQNCDQITAINDEGILRRQYDDYSTRNELGKYCDIEKNRLQS
jgi:hypothetical protein